MKTKLIAALSALALCSSAQAALISGWDFSQYSGDGQNSIDGATFTNVLSANYSSFGSVTGAGPQSAAFGTFYYNGQFGSTNVTTNFVDDEVYPSAFIGSLTSNLTTAQNGVTTFDRHTVLIDQGQTFAGSYSMLNTAPVSLVFSGDVSSTVDGYATDWSISFASKINAGTGSILVEFSTDGSNYSVVETINVTTTDTAFTSNLGSQISDAGYVRLTMNDNAIFLDNVALQGTLTTAPIPEPSAFAALAGLAVIGMTVFRRRRTQA
ncbi:MAG: PEP-CTERM sorting domain-containing protein [Verrucomicrobiota bacterium]